MNNCTFGQSNSTNILPISESYLNSDKELFKPSKMLMTIIWRSEPINGKKYRSTILDRGKDRGETTWRSKSCSSRWWNEELPEWHFKRKLPANTSTDKSRIETASSKKTNNPWPYIGKNTWRYVVSCKIGKATPSWTKTALMSCKKESTMPTGSCPML